MFLELPLVLITGSLFCLSYLHDTKAQISMLGIMYSYRVGHFHCLQAYKFWSRYCHWGIGRIIKVELIVPIFLLFLKLRKLNSRILSDLFMTY